MEYIFKHNGTEKPDTRKITAVLRNYHARILDKSNFPRLFLVTADNIETLIEQIKEQLPGNWDIFPNKKVFKIPTTKPKINKLNSDE